MKHKKLFSFIIITMIIIIAGCDNSNTFSSKSDTESYNKSSSSTILVSQEESSKPDISGKGSLWTDKKIKVGFRTIGPISSWQVANSADILRAAEDWNIELAFSDGTGGQEVEITALQSYIENNKDVIGFAPIKENGYEEILREVKEAGIPVILIDRTVNCADESLWTSYIVNDRYKQGQMSGEWLINYLKGKGEIDKNIRIVELNGPEES